MSHPEEYAIDEVKDLILEGREQGFLSSDRVADVLQDVDLNTEQIENIYAMFLEMGIEVVEEEGDLLSQDQIDQEKEAYLAALGNLAVSAKSNQSLSLSSQEAINLDRAAFAMRDTAFALRSNERSVLADIQHQVADTQELMARRLALSADVDLILFGVSDARQKDRDFSLATNDHLLSKYSSIR